MFKQLALVALGLSLLSSAPSPAAPLVREEGAYYLSDFDLKPLKLKVLQPGAPAYFDLKLSQYVGSLRYPQTVEVQAITDSHYRIRGNAQQGQILGWVDRQALEPLAPDFLSNLEKTAERKKLVDALIAKNEVAMGMTPDEVQASVGKPNKRTQRTNANGSEAVWEYVKYKNVPQYTTSYDAFGQPFTTVTYIKVPVGKLAVVFQGDVVTALEQSEGDLSGGEKVSIVPAPIIVY